MKLLKFKGYNGITVYINPRKISAMEYCEAHNSIDFFMESFTESLSVLGNID